MTAANLPLDRIGSLSLKERLFLCRRVAAAAVDRLRALAQRTDPDDLALRGLFEKLGRTEEGRLRALEEIDARTDGPSLLDRVTRDEIVRGALPSLSTLPGEALIGREAGTYWAECLAEESARLYRALADQAEDEESRAFFLRSQEENLSALAFLRKVLL